MSENNDASNESNSRSSSEGVFRSSRSTNPIIRSGVLRPSVLGPSLGCNNVSSSTKTKTTESTHEGKSTVLANNPFLKEPNEEFENENESEDGPGTSRTSKNKSNEDTKKADDEKEERPDPLLLLRRNGMERASMFAAAKNSIPLVEKSGFVFGQNVHERVVGDNINPEKSKSGNDSGDSNGELLFSSVIQKAAAKNEDSEGAGASGIASKETETKSLTDVAREYEESRAQKRKYEEVETFTGEEDEVNICDVSCKLFAFVNSNWEERGRGSLRINDSKAENECSRVVFRTSGNLRLLLNTKVWAGMVAERPSQKSLRLTAIDPSGKVKIFLAMARPVEIDALHTALRTRIDKRKRTNPEECRNLTSASNGDANKNGADEHADAAAIAEPSVIDDNGEPSPKKNVQVGEVSTT